MDRDRLFDLLGACETKLLKSLNMAQEALDTIRQARDSLNEDAMRPSDREPGLPNAARDEVVKQVLAALEQPRNGAAAGGDGWSLIYRKADESFSVGRRRVALTDTETNILGIFWRSMPEPVSRDALLATLYPQDQKPGSGVIDVFISKLRQKLKLASDGCEFVESIRGKGWALRSDLCRAEAD